MKLDVATLRYLSKDDFRILSAIETGMRNHEVVPTELIASIAGLRGGGIHKLLGDLLRAKLINHEHVNYEGYTLTYPGYDFLALKTLLQRGTISGVGRQIGVGKESDIFLVQGPLGQVYALKLQRLGRTSFRAVKSKRDYLKHRKSVSWLYLSRLAALKEFAFMRALGDAGFPVPTAVDHNRHALVMTLARGRNISLLRSVGPSAGAVFAHIMSLMLRLSACGLVHCDFNEFNLLLDVPGLEGGTIAGMVTGGAVAVAGAGAQQEAINDGKSDDGAEDGPSSGLTPIRPLSFVPDSGTPPVTVTMIDFPQMVSMDHPNARELFDRDVATLAVFFSRRFGHDPEGVPSWEDALAAAAAAVESRSGSVRLDRAVEASGFTADMAAQLDEMLEAQAGDVNPSSSVDDDGAEESAVSGGGEFVTVNRDVIDESRDDDDDDDEDEDQAEQVEADERADESNTEDADSSDNDVGGLPTDDPRLSLERVPDGVRSRAGGKKPRPVGGEAYLRRAPEGSAGARVEGADGDTDIVAGGVSRADVRAKVKGSADKARARADAATLAHRAGRHNKQSSMKHRLKNKDLGKGETVWG